jgi:endonuclease-3
LPRETAAARKARALHLVKLLEQGYPDAACALQYRSAFELLVATILSAQCTDKMVNQVTPALFARFPTPAAMADADPAEIERLIQPTGFFRQKTRSIQSASQDLVTRFGGRVPDTLEALVTLRGVGRKTANVVLGNAFDVPGLTVDTHMTRVNRRLGLTRETDPEKIERDLMQLVPRSEWTLYSHRVIHHGRVCCEARRPRCETCPLREACPWPQSAAARAVRPAARSARAPARAKTARRKSGRR